tara:strand:- start:219 stop:566 length:348 start_codon:yes stop_codon:yes gene_type:complete
MAGFGLPNFGQITEAFKKAQQIQQDAQKIQEELDSMELEGADSEKLISIWLSGNQLPLKVKIDPKLVEIDKESIELKILEALQNAHEQSTSTMKSKMQELTGDLNLNLPGLNPKD